MNDANSNVDAIPLPINQRIKWFVNNQRFADVQFVVGAKRQLVYAHKMMIASGSPVFEQMFFANHNLRMTGGEPIEIPDLTPRGFINMLTYIYTNDMKELDLSELFETYMAGDKYQVYNMSDTMFAFIKNVLSTSNCCIIYDQLMKFPTENIVPLDEVKKLIRYNSESAFKNKYFVNISKETLVDLLSMDGLSMKEIEVLRSCAQWVDAEIKRLNLKLNETNKQMVFKSIKNLIRFSDITFDEFKNFDEIKYLLLSDELNSLFLHLLNISKFTVECNTARMRLQSISARCNRFANQSGYACDYDYDYGTHQNLSELSLVIKISKSVAITNISTNVQGLELSIYDMANAKVELRYEKLSSQSDNFWYFKFVDSVTIDSTKQYKFVFKFQYTSLFYNQLSTDKKMILTDEDQSFVINLSSFGSYHCLQKIDFHSLS